MAGKDGQAQPILGFAPAAIPSSIRESTMPVRTPKSIRSVPPVGTADLLANLDHPRKADILAVRRAILAADRRIADGVKWNSVSFLTNEYFATVHLRSKASVQLVFHFGAKKRDLPEIKLTLPPGFPVRWLGRDRCLVDLGAGAGLKSRLPVLRDFVRQWIRYV